MQTLLISDSLFRTSDVNRRKRYVRMVAEVEEGELAGRQRQQRPPVLALASSARSAG
jgi:hypothetical protein